MTAILFENRADWLAARRKNVGGSEVACLFGVQAPYQMSMYTLWQVKAGKIPEPDVGGERAAWGLRLEAAIAEGAAETHGWEIEKGGYVQHPTVEGAAVSLDYVIKAARAVHTGEMPGPFPGALEIKNSDWMVHKNQWADGEPPIHVQLQLQHQLACTGYEWGYVVSLIGGNKLAEPYFFTRRPKIIAEIEKRVAAFWQSIREDKPPPVDGSESTAGALAALFPEATPGLSIDMSTSNEFPEAFATLKQARLDKKAAEAAERASKNAIMEMAGEAELIKYGETIVATLKSQTRKSYVVKESSSRVLRLKDE